MNGRQFTAGDFWLFSEAEEPTVGSGGDIWALLTMAEAQANRILETAGHPPENVRALGGNRPPGVEPGSLPDLAHMVVCGAQLARVYITKAKADFPHVERSVALTRSMSGDAAAEARLAEEGNRQGRAAEIAALSVADFMAKFMIMQSLAAGVDGHFAILGKRAAETADRQKRGRRDQATQAQMDNWGAEALSFARRARAADPNIGLGTIARRLLNEPRGPGRAFPATADTIYDFLRQHGITAAPRGGGGT